MKADKVDISNPDDDVISVMFATNDLADNCPKYWSFARASKLFDDDSSVYLERDDQSLATNGGVEKCILKRNSFWLLFNTTASFDLKSEREILIQFEVSDKEFDLLKQTLDFIFSNHSNYQVTL